MRYVNQMIDNPGKDPFLGFDMQSLGMDQAYLNIENFSPRRLYLYELIEECVNCPFRKTGDLDIGNTTIKLSTRFKTAYRILTDNVLRTSESDLKVVCDVSQGFGQFGVYGLQTNGEYCNFRVLKDPVNIYLPILTVILIYSTLFIIPIYSIIKDRFKKQEEANENKTVEAKERLKSLDTFRGISIVLMIFVNYGGGGYVFMDHAIWNGLQVADLVFPWFMWIMGVCIPMSIKSVLKRNAPKRKAFLNILRRSITLFLIGVFLGSGTNLEKLRIFGVLQRFGICYLVVATMCLFTMSNTDCAIGNKTWRKIFADVITSYKMWIITIIILAIHCIVIFVLQVENCPRGYLGPGGLHDNGKYYNCTGGVTGYVDDLILGDHVYHYPTIKEIYDSKSFDPEGILGCLTSIMQVFLGVKAGIILLITKCHKQRVVRWMIWALITGMIGGGLCGFSKEDGVIPINKNLWSISFVLVTSSLAFILLSICYLLIDVLKFWAGKPFLFAGMNAIVMYIGHSMTYSNFPIRWNYRNNETHFLRLFENAWGTICWVFVAYYLYKKKRFYSI